MNDLTTPRSFRPRPPRSFRLNSQVPIDADGGGLLRRRGRIWSRRGVKKRHPKHENSHFAWTTKSLKNKKSTSFSLQVMITQMEPLIVCPLVGQVWKWRSMEQRTSRAAEMTVFRKKPGREERPPSVETNGRSVCGRGVFHLLPMESGWREEAPKRTAQASWGRQEGCSSVGRSVGRSQWHRCPRGLKVGRCGFRQAKSAVSQAGWQGGGWRHESKKHLVR